ncbi:MAG: glycosyltransferase family 4 protein [candidate division Zixibacteria bacterium]|nr:glycosyltransferase family 4 protein [candidate division Zixibacteria bacterium]
MALPLVGAGRLGGSDSVVGRMAMHILQVCSSLAWGGTEMHVPILTRRLHARGHRVGIVAHPSGRILAEARAADLTTYPLPMGRYVSPLTTARLARLLQTQKPDIVHLHLSRDLWQTVPAARLSGCPALVLTKHIGSYIRKFDPLHRYLYSRVARIVTVSDVLNRNVRDTCPVPPDRVVTIHHALDMTRYDPNRYDTQAVRGELGIPPQAIVVGVVGRISPGKGVEDFLQAAARVANQTGDHPLLFLIIGAASFGEERYYSDMVALSGSLGLDKRVVFTGFRSDVPAVLSAMDIFVFPSRAEGLGATLIEAMAMRIACVSTFSDGTLDIVAHDRTALTYTPGDVDKLADAVFTLIQNDTLRARLAEAGYRHVREHFDIDRMTDRIEQVYENVIHARTDAAVERA